MWGRALGVSGCLFVLAGCSTVPLPRRFPLSSVTSTLDIKGGEFLQAESISVEVGLQLKPGDVIYLRRWSAGVANPEEAVKLNRTTPPAFFDRVPLRHVPSGARLYDYEREFLINVLSLNRSPAFKNVDATEGLPEALLGKEVALWNALVDSLWVKRLGDGGPWKSEKSHDSLLLVVRMPALVESLPGNYQKLFSDTNKGPDKRDREVASLEVPLGSPYLAISQSTSANGGYYNMPTNKASPALVNFLTVELGGAEMTDPGPQEGMWTLDDWEKSGICLGGTPWGDVAASIRTVWLKGYASGMEVVPADAAYDVILDLSKRSRYLQARHRFSWLYPSIDRKALGLLTARDIRRLEWSVAGAESSHITSGCSLR